METWAIVLLATAVLANTLAVLWLSRRLGRMASQASVEDDPEPLARAIHRRSTLLVDGKPAGRGR